MTLTEAKPMTAAFEPWPASAPAVANLGAEIVAYHHPEHPASKEYALLLEAMRGALKKGVPCVLLLFGMKQHVGTSTVLLNLAVSAAMKQNLRVAVVDANAHQAGLAKRLGYTGTGGLQDIVAGSLALEHGLVKTPVAGLSLLPAGSIKKPAMLTGEMLGWITAWLRERFDLIFIDAPTLEDANELALQIPHSDGVYLVLAHGEMLNREIAQIVGRMGGRLCGLIHTHLDM
jgi:Mrp family chromosome partitioning ATPase